MIKIAICDTDILFRKKLRSLCEAYFQEKELEYQIQQYSSGEEMLADNNPDILLMDVRLKRINGILVKEILEAINAETRVLFISENRNHMSDAFGKGVYGYLIKPLKEELFHQKMDAMLSDVHQQSQYVYCKEGCEIKKVFFKDILYIEVAGRMTNICVKGTENRLYCCTVSKALDQWEEVLPLEQFVRVNKRQIVNLAYIVDIKGEIELINFIKIPIGASYKDRVWEKNNEFKSRRNIIHKTASGTGGSTSKIY